MATPISVLDYSTITRSLMESREWTGAKGGVPMRLVRYNTRKGEVIEVALQLKPSTWLNEKFTSVKAALDQCNRLISERRGVSPVVALPLAAAAVSRAEQWLPYKDA